MFRVLGIFTFAAIFALLGYMRQMAEARRRESDEWLRKLMSEDDELLDPDHAGA